MAPTLTSHTSGGIAMLATPQTLTLPATTNLNDCIVVGISVKNSPGGAGLAVAGAGGTWTGYHTTTPGNSNSALWVAYATTAGNTTVSLTNGGSGDGVIDIGIFSGVSTTSAILASGVTTTVSANGVAVVTPSVSYTAGDLLVGSSDSFSAFASGNPTWSSGATDNKVDQTTTGSRFNWTSYTVPVSGTSTTYTSAVPNSGQGANAIVVVLAAAPSSSVIYPVHPRIVPQAVNRSTVF